MYGEIEDLRGENEILREAVPPLIHRAPARERFAFVHARRNRFGVKRLCRGSPLVLAIGTVITSFYDPASHWCP